MTPQRGRVLRVEGSVAWVECVRPAACELCTGGADCPGGIAGPSRAPPQVVRARAPDPAPPPGAPVELVLPHGALLRAAGVAYGLPLATLLLGATLGSPGGAAMAPLGAGLGLVCGVLLGRLVSRHALVAPPYGLRPR